MMDNAKVIYVEDEPDYQRLVSEILNEEGLSVEIAGNGKDGLRLLEQNAPKLLLLDVQLPDMDGFSLCQRLRKMTPWKDLPILMLTVLGRPEEWRRGFASGATDYIAKPLNPPEFIEHVLAFLEKRRDADITGLESAEFKMVRSAAAGNKGAFESLWRQYQPVLRRTFSGLLRNVSAADDLVASAFLVAWKRLGEYRGQSSFKTWLYGIALNLLKQKWRHNATSAAEITWEIPDNWLKDSGDFLDRIERKANLSTLEHAMQRVPPRYRTALQWNVVQGLPRRELARRWRVPIGTAATRITEAKRLLKEAWERDLESSNHEDSPPTNRENGSSHG